MKSATKKAASNQIPQSIHLGSRPMATVVQSATIDELPVSIQEIIGRNIRDFLIRVPEQNNRYAYYRSMERLDPEVLIARNYLALMIQRSYLGPKLDTSDENYLPTKTFMEKVQLILAEMSFSTRIAPLVKDMIRHGDAYLRIRRDDWDEEESQQPRNWKEASGKNLEIMKTEVIAPDIITIISEEYKDDPDRYSADISEADYFVLNEREDRKGEDYKVVYNSREEPKPDEQGNPHEIVLPSRDILHISWDREGNQHIDILGRTTYGIYGRSVYESIIAYSKIKLTVMTDYLRWMRVGMPRWVANINLADVLDITKYEGSHEQRTQKAIEEAQKVLNMFAENLYYKDTNKDSPTYNKKMPIEADAFLVFDGESTMEQKGGVSPDPAVTNLIRECNRAISSAMGVPMSLFGYEEGSTYAIGRVTSKFLSGYGGGLLRSVENDLKEFLKKEFIRRKWDATQSDWENLYLDYDKDDTEEEKLKKEAELASANVAQVLATAAATLYNNYLCTMNEARSIVSGGVEALKKIGDRADGHSIKPLQPALPSFGQGLFAPQAVHVHGTPSQEIDQGDKLLDEVTLPEEQPDLEAEAKQSVNDSYTWFAEEVASKVERGDYNGKERNGTEEIEGQEEQEKEQ